MRPKRRMCGLSVCSLEQRRHRLRADLAIRPDPIWDPILSRPAVVPQVGRASSPDEFTRLTAITWIHDFIGAPLRYYTPLV